MLEQDEGARVEVALGEPPGEGVDQVQLFPGQVCEQPLQQLKHGVSDGLVRGVPGRVPDELEVVVRKGIQPGQVSRDLPRSAQQFMKLMSIAAVCYTKREKTKPCGRPERRG